MLFLVFVAVASSVVLAQQQCPTMYARFSTTHSYCLPPNNTCNIVRSGVDEAAKREILKTHNELRSKVAMGKEKQAGGLPMASNMLEMEWDNELAEIAQRWASQCNYNHDCPNCRAVEGFGVGQNLAQQTVKGCQDQACMENAMKPEWKSRINQFYDEVRFFNKDLVKKYQHRDEYGHFAQVIWGASWRVGCGYVVYQEGNVIYRYYACNYGPGGNIGNAEVYKAGRPCTGCPANTCCGNCASQDPKYTGLCQVLNKDLGPLDQSVTPGTLIDCNWKTGRPTCNFQIDGEQDWTIKPSLGGGPYYSINLNGGEQSSLQLPTPIKAMQSSFCLLVVFRKSPADAATNDASVAVADLSVGDWHSKLTLKSTSITAFTPYHIDLSWNYETQAVFRFSVPGNAPEHIIDLRQIIFYDGKCKK